MFVPTPGGAGGQVTFESVNKAVFSVRILYGAMILGISSFAAIAFIVPAPETALEPRLLIIIGSVMTATLAIPAPLFGSLMAARGVSSIRDDGRLDRESVQGALRVWVGSRLLAAAMIEGPGLFWCVICLLFRDPIYLAGVGFSVLWIATVFPHAGQLESLLGRDLAELDAALAPTDSSA